MKTAEMQRVGSHQMVVDYFLGQAKGVIADFRDDPGDPLPVSGLKSKNAYPSSNAACPFFPFLGEDIHSGRKYRNNKIMQESGKSFWSLHI